MRIVVDTNIILSAAMKKNTPPAQVLSVCFEKRATLISTDWQMNEIVRVLAYPRITRRIGAAARTRWIESVRDIAVIVLPTESAEGAVPRDPDDDHIIEAAVAGHAEYIVTGDNDLLPLKSYEGIEIVTPARFLAVIGRREG